MSPTSITLPEAPGLLPYFLLYTSFAALTHSAVTYFSSPAKALIQFQGPNAPPHHALLAHVYGVKNIYTAAIRFYYAYHLSSPELYNLALLTFIGVLGLYIGELVVYKTVRPREMLIPFITSSLGLIWMLTQRSFYLHQ